MRAGLTRRLVRKRRRTPAELLVVASGGQEIASAVELLSTSLGPEARIVTARYQDTSQGFVLLMSLTISGGSAAVRRIIGLLTSVAEANEMTVVTWPVSREGGRS